MAWWATQMMMVYPGDGNGLMQGYMNAAAAGTAFPRADHRTTFLNATPEMPGFWRVHHLLPQPLRERYAAIGINIDSLNQLRGLDPIVHDEINAAQRLFDELEMQRLGILQPGERLSPRNQGAAYRRYWPIADLQKVQTFNTRLAETYERYLLSSGGNQARVRQIQTFVDGGRSRGLFQSGRGSRLASVLPHLATALGIFAVIGENAAFASNIVSHSPLQEAAFQSFIGLYNSLVNRVIYGGHIRANDAQNLRQRFIQYLQAIDASPNAVNVINATMGAWIDANVPP
jgi:hypothetical protein